ncbi:ISAs1 family transposase [Mucilaginibacter rubeus]|nr:ISAs1 family transposase [Mucilaginibacter rubeus]
MLPLENGIPSHDTINRVFMMIDADVFERCFRAWTAELGQSLQTTGTSGERELIAIDGKSVCNSACKHQGLGALHLVSAWSGRNQLVLGQQKVADKSNEISAIPALLSLLNIKGAVVSIDAMGTQKAIAEKIIESQGDYILALKQNHETFYDQVTNQFNFREDSYSQHLDKGHGRSEIRTCKVIHELNWIDEKENWKGIKSIIKITSERIIGDSRTTQNRYYISSLQADAAYFNKAIRTHWGIENQLHWQLDVGFAEDYNTTRNSQAAQNLAVVRKIALNILKADKTSKASIKAKRKMAGWNHKFLLTLIANKNF